VGRRVGVMIRLDFDQAAPDAVNQENRSDQIGRHLVNAAAEEGAGERPGHVRIVAVDIGE
jgi:hypothetical protein